MWPLDGVIFYKRVANAKFYFTCQTNLVSAAINRNEEVSSFRRQIEMLVSLDKSMVNHR